MINEEERSRRRAVFLHVLARSGNVVRAGGEARASRCWLYGERRGDAGFARAWDAALDAARATIGSEIDAGSAGAGRWLRRLRGIAQEARSREGEWSAECEAAFLTALAGEPHVMRAAGATGMSPQACYRRRRLFPGFARAWDAALGEGRAALDAKLLRQAANGTRDDGRGGRVIAEADEDRAIEDPGFALGVAKLQAALAERRARETAAAAEEEPIEVVRDEVLRRLTAIRAHRENRGGEDGAGGKADGRDAARRE